MKLHEVASLLLRMRVVSAVEGRSGMDAFHTSLVEQKDRLTGQMENQRQWVSLVL